MCLNFSSKKQASFNLVTAVTIRSDFGAQENKTFQCFSFFPIYLPWSDGTGCPSMIFNFWMLNFKPDFLLFSFTLIKGLSNLILASESCSPAFCMICLRMCMLSHFSHSNSLWPYGLWPIRLFCNGILQARILAWVEKSSSGGSSWLRDWNHVSWDSCTAVRFFTAEPLGRLFAWCTVHIH